MLKTNAMGRRDHSEGQEAKLSSIEELSKFGAKDKMPWDRETILRARRPNFGRLRTFLNSLLRQNAMGRRDHSEGHEAKLWPVEEISKFPPETKCHGTERPF